MYSVDPEFKMSYDIRNDQEANVRRHKRVAHTRGDGDESHSRGNEKPCDLMGSNGMRWACLTGLALLGLGVGYQLGHDQYDKYKSTMVRLQP